MVPYVTRLKFEKFTTFLKNLELLTNFVKLLLGLTELTSNAFMNKCHIDLDFNIPKTCIVFKRHSVPVLMYIIAIIEIEIKKYIVMLF